MAEDRTPREATTREKTARKKGWLPPQLLPDPRKEEGWEYRWIRTSMMGQADATNVSSKMREGWEPVRAEDHPELMLQADPNSRFKGNVEIGGLLLCKAPTEMVQERNAYYSMQNKAQVDSVDNHFMRQSDERMPLFSERKSNVSFGKGVK